MQFDPTNLDAIYGDNFTYSLPRVVLESFLSGQAFGREAEYSAEEQELLWEKVFR